MKTPFITVGIASYNYDAYLRAAFEAIKRQSFKDYEILYADDGSTDNSVETIETFIKENPEMRIRLIKGENIGLMGNKQRLIDNAQGVYLMLCDADDWMDDNCLETLSSAAKMTDADRIVSEIRNVNGDTGKKMYVQSFSRQPSKWCEALHHGALYKLSVIKDNNIRMPNMLPDDFLFITRFNIFSKSTSFVRNSVYNWRLHSRSESHKCWQENRHRGANLLKNILMFLTDFEKEFNGILEKEDIEDIQLALVKNYCYYCIKDISATEPISKAREEFQRINRLIQDSVPDYNRLIYKKKLYSSPFRPSIHVTICLLSFLDQIQLLFPALMVFGTMNRLTKRHSL